MLAERRGTRLALCLYRSARKIAEGVYYGFAEGCASYG